MKIAKRIALLFTGLFFIGSPLFAQLNMTLRANYAYGGDTTCAGIWGYVDGPGNEYALVGISYGLSIVDITNPDSPVEKFFAPTVENLWHEVEVWNQHAYVTTEGGGGLLIVDLSNLPNSINSKLWTGNGAVTGQVDELHALQIADGYAYLYGGNYKNGGCIIADLSDPWNPNYVGEYELDYIHDGYVRNDTLYAGQIYFGGFAVIDVTNKANPVVLATQMTPGAFTHNTWLSDNSRVLFTTDEVNNAPMTSYDISDLANIKELDRYFTTITPDQEVHNVYVKNDFLICADYGSQVTLVDAARPDNLVEVGRYTTVGTDLCWDVHGALPSENIIVADELHGLFVFTPTYVRACYLEGVVTDSITNNPLNSVRVEIVSTTAVENTNLIGEYKTGSASAGTYNVQFYKAGYEVKTVSGVTLTTGVLTTLNVALKPAPPFTLMGQVQEAGSGTPIPNAYVHIKNTDFDFNLTTDGSGNFSIPNFFSGPYDITAGKWMYVTNGFIGKNITSSTGTLIIQLSPGVYDDFTFNFGWTASGTAFAGWWIREEPVGMQWYWGGPPYANPEYDVSYDFSEECFVTGNSGSWAWDDDVDGGKVILTSPLFDATNYLNPYVSYSRWFFDIDAPWSVPDPPTDSLKVKITNGSTTVTLENVVPWDTVYNMGEWVQRSFRLGDYIAPSNQMRITFETADWKVDDWDTSGNVVDAAIDKFQITEGPPPEGIVNNTINPNEIYLLAYPNPFGGEMNIKYDLNAKPQTDSKIIITDILGRTAEEIPIRNQNGIVSAGKNISAGMYFVKIQNGNKSSAVKKIIRLQ